jgi:hypothetical protein
MSNQNQTLIYTEQGGAKQVVSSGGEIELQSGGALDLQSGATATMAGTTNVTGTMNVTGTLKKDGVDVTAKQVFSVFHNVTVAEVNAGHELLPAITGRQYKIIGYYIKALGGAAGTATALVIGDGASPVVAVVTANVAALTENAEVGSFGTVSNVTKGAGFCTALTVSQAVNVTKTGSTMDTVVSFDILLLYQIV